MKLMTKELEKEFVNYPIGSQDGDWLLFRKCTITVRFIYRT